MTTWQAMRRLEELGYSFRLTEVGKVQAMLMGPKPPEAAPLLDIARADRDSAADYVRQRQQGASVVAIEREVSPLEALAVSLAVQAGVAQLVGKVRLYGGHIFITWMGAELPDWMENARERVRRELKQMDESRYWEMSAAEFERMCRRYGAWARLCEEPSNGGTPFGQDRKFTGANQRIPYGD